MKESDWKLFKKIKTQALDLYCKNALNDFKQIIDETEKTHHERYGEIYELVHKRDKTLAALFDGHSRSKADLQLMLMRREKIVNQTLISQMSEEFQDQTNPFKFN
ncbi:MAG: hypothetical protein HRU38_17665 [Saccharospirillaceae bacterium]|nr:hypothetical protein [Pseudomonadales bacterium]NRB80468.1 hypothetical protein [Saccharospirillaceae bacterium]